MHPPFVVAVRYHLAGLGCVVLGAAWTESTGSMLPLAMGAAVAVMTTVGLVRALRRRAAERRWPVDE